MPGRDYRDILGGGLLVAAGLFTPVATDGASVLYRIDQCGPLA